MANNKSIHAIDIHEKNSFKPVCDGGVHDYRCQLKGPILLLSTEPQRVLQWPLLVEGLSPLGKDTF